MGIEFEMKYSATPEQQDALLAAYELSCRVIRMETTYYDTPSAAFSDRHITLRRRMENDVSVCTVKTPVEGYGRGEWECGCDDILSALPKLIALGAPEALAVWAAEGLQEVCAARFTRQAADFNWNGAVLEIALDRGVLIGGGREVPLCEIEVELKSGEPDSAMAFARELAERYGLRSEKKSKFRRALALAKEE